MAYYAVKAGKKPGIYETWDGCKAQVHGFKGAIYKKFDKKADAEAFIGAPSGHAPDLDVQQVPTDAAIAYVDGSFNVHTGTFGYGVVLFTDQGKETFQGCATGDDASHRNVAGEVYGSLFAVEKAIAQGKKRIYVHYDYAGIRHWALGEWKRNLPLTQRYHASFQAYLSKIEVEFVKVKAHSNDVYNDEADRLAKDACGVE